MKKILLAVLLAAVMLTGCDIGQSGTTVKGDVYPKIIQYVQYGADTTEYTYFYAVDERTGVVYLLGQDYYRLGITVALNADGSPVTKDQLEAWREDE